MLMYARREPFKKGMTMVWPGAIADIPAGWALCNGSNGTPNMTDRVVIGAGGGLVFNSTGGSVSHTHAFTGNGHDHDIESGPEIQAGEGYALTVSEETAGGTTNPASTLPPYRVLPYIMKL